MARSVLHKAFHSDSFRVHYLPSRPRDIQWVFHVTGAGRAAIPPGVAYPPPQHPQLYAFTWKKGSSLPEY